MNVVNDKAWLIRYLKGHGKNCEIFNEMNYNSFKVGEGKEIEWTKIVKKFCVY